MRYITRQAAAAKPIRIALAALAIDWTTVLEAPDFSVLDTTRRFPLDRDPLNDQRRIQPGFALVEAPLMFHNASDAEQWVEVRILTEAGLSVVQSHQVIPARDTYPHPAPGQRLLKLLIATANGDRLQVRAQTAGVIHLTGAASEGSAEQHEPEVTA